MFFSVLPQITLDASDYRTVTGNLRRGFPKVHRELMGDAATYWHHRIFPGHFTPGNESRYQMKPRSPEYLKRKRRYGSGQGKHVANVFSGMSFRWLMSTLSVTKTQDSATARMKAPTYFTNPSKPRGVQPDKPAEVTQINDRDLTELQRYMQRRYDELVEQFLNRGNTLAKEA